MLPKCLWFDGIMCICPCDPCTTNIFYDILCVHTLVILLHNAFNNMNHSIVSLTCETKFGTFSSTLCQVMQLNENRMNDNGQH